MQPPPPQQTPEGPDTEPSPRLARTRRGHVSSRIFRQQLHQGMPRTWVTEALIAVNCLVFVAMIATGASPLDPTADRVLQMGGVFGPLAMQGEPWRLVSTGFVHIGIVHLAMNMLCLVQLGRFLERLLGHGTLLAIYFFSLLASSLISICFLDGAVGAGASGAVFGLIGSLFSCMRALRNAVPKEIFADLRVWLGLFVAYNVLTGLTSPSILNSAHISGLIAGFVGTLILCRARMSKEVRVPLLTSNRRMFVPLVAMLALAYFGVDIATRDQPLHRTYHDRLAIDEATEREDHEAMISLADRILAVSPDDAYVNGLRGLTLATLGRFEEALPATQDAARLDTTNPAWRGNLAWIFTELKRYHEAVAAARDALRLDPRQQLAHESLLAGLAKLDDNETLLKAARKAEISQGDSSAVVLFHLSWAEHLAGNRDAARKAVERGLVLDPNDTWAQDHLKSLLDQR